MGRYVEGQDRTQSVLFAERLDDWINEDSTVRLTCLVLVADVVGAQLRSRSSHPDSPRGTT